SCASSLRERRATAAAGREKSRASFGGLRATLLQGVLVVADLVAPELALKLPVIPVLGGHLRPVDGLLLEYGLLIDTGLGELLLGLGGLEADDLGVVREALHRAIGLDEAILGELPGHLLQRAPVLVEVARHLA